MKKLVFNKRMDFSYIEGEILCITTGNKQDIIILVLDKKVTDIYYYKIIHWLKPGVLKQYTIENNQYFNFIQPLGENWILVKSFVEKKEDTTATIFDEKGTIIDSHYLGNGIKYFQVDEEEHLLVGYSEEGIFTSVDELFISDEEFDSIDWENIYDTNKLEKSGLAIFSKNGDLITNEFNNSIKRSVCDCTAINIQKTGDILMSYYNEQGTYSFTQINKERCEQVILYETTLNHTSLYLKVENNIIFGVDNNQIYAYSLVNKKLATLLTVDSDGNPIQFEYIFSRDQTIYAVKENSVYCWEQHGILEDRE
ncbi:hypothetical protein P4U03_15480 [Bacillus mycoides]|uniref:Uncharacterized protein n=1 Tax=Bacillus thuringiensis serovar navarrensis TaxID=339658 RepID=A0A243APG0_BACTU|nr:MULTISPECIES: hypothetical protein [Bacillus cereus group]MED1267989.1 hypothetical protein [Bacillus mycoides]OTY28170.1 hypothetical protein BK732_03425 [Bacillus thuringiensis serovar navarrensis]